jgi:hypothetical protein
MYRVVTSMNTCVNQPCEDSTPFLLTIVKARRTKENQKSPYGLLVMKDFNEPEVIVLARDSLGRSRSITHRSHGMFIPKWRTFESIPEP